MASTLPELPDELLLKINKYLPTNDLLKFRLTSDSIAAAAATTIAERLHRLYVHPSEPALRAVPHICAHPVFGPAITEVVLIGYTPYKDIGECKRDKYGRHTPHWQRTFATWPHVFPRSKADVLSEHQEAEHTMQALQRSMAQLPNLHKIAFAHRIATPGFNQVTRAVIKALPKRHIGKRTAVIDSRFQDVQAFANVMELPLAANFTELHITRAMPFSRPGTITQGWRAVNLTKVTLPVDLSEINVVEEGIAWDWLSHVARVLKELHNVEQLTLDLHVQSKYGRRRENSIFSSNSFGLQNTTLMQHTFPFLRQLCVRAPRDRPAPFVQVVFDWLGFLRRHVQTLRIVTIWNVLLKEDAINTMIDTVKELRNGGVDISYRLNRLDHEPGCDGTQCQEQHCVISYGVRHGSWHVVDAHVLDQLANEMGVKLSEDGSYWDFGTMRKGGLMDEMDALSLTTQ